MKKSKHINPEVMSLEIGYILQRLGINAPLFLEILRIFIHQLIKSLSPSELEKYSMVIKTAKKIGRHTRKMLKHIISSCNENEVKIIESLFMGFLIASVFAPEIEVGENE